MHYLNFFIKIFYEQIHILPFNELF